MLAAAPPGRAEAVGPPRTTPRGGARARRAAAIAPPSRVGRSYGARKLRTESPVFAQLGRRGGSSSSADGRGAVPTETRPNRGRPGVPMVADAMPGSASIVSYGHWAEPADADTFLGSRWRTVVRADDGSTRSPRSPPTWRGTGPWTGPGIPRSAAPGGAAGHQDRGLRDAGRPVRRPGVRNARPGPGGGRRLLHAPLMRPIEKTRVGSSAWQRPCRRGIWGAAPLPMHSDETCESPTAITSPDGSSDLAAGRRTRKGAAWARRGRPGTARREGGNES